MPKTKSTNTKGSTRSKATKKEDTTKKKTATAGKTAGRKAASAPKKAAPKSTPSKKKSDAGKKAAPKKAASRTTASKSSPKTAAKKKSAAPAKKTAATKAASAKKTTKVAKKAAEKKSTAETAKKKAAPKGAATGAKKKQMPKKTTSKKPAAAKKKASGKASFKEEMTKTLLEAKSRILNEVSQKMKSESNVLKFEIGDIYDIASSERERELALTLGDRDRQKLAEIEEALERINDDTYCECEECGEPIEQGRLKALPFTRVCVECQSRLEREQRIRGRFEEEAPGLGGMVEKSDNDEDEF